MVQTHDKDGRRSSEMDRRVGSESPTARQCRAARIVLGWGLIEASRRTGLSIATISRSEREEDGIQSVDTRAAVKLSYERAGISFVQSQDNHGIYWDKLDGQSRPWSPEPWL